MRIFIALTLSFMLTSCGIAPVPPISDLVLGSIASYALFGDDLDEIKKEDLTDPKAIRGAVPPRAKDSAHRVANNMRDNVRNTAKHMKKWWFAKPVADRPPHSVPPSYCYRVLQDVLCYQKPMPGWEGRLVAYQGTLAMAPAALKTQPLPKIDKGDTVTPEAQLKKAAPVFTAIPDELKKTKSEVQDMSGAAQETLPDPLITPQL